MSFRVNVFIKYSGNLVMNNDTSRFNLYTTVLGRKCSVCNVFFCVSYRRDSSALVLQCLCSITAICFAVALQYSLQ